MHEDFLSSVRAGDAERVRALLAEHADLASSRDAENVSALLLALYHGHTEVADAVRAAGLSLDVFEAAAVGDAERMGALLDADRALANAYAADGFTPLGLAAFFKRPEMVRLLLARGADPNAASRNRFWFTPLHSALADAADAELARPLLDAGADPNPRQFLGSTPLHSAAYGGNLEAVRLLLERGADANARNDAGKTALALARERGHAAVAGVLERAAAG